MDEEKKKEERRRREKKQRDYDILQLHTSPAIEVNHDNDEDDHSERNLKIFAAIATAVVFLILFNTIGLFGIAIFGLIAGGLLKK